jgi:hypothetical protein
VSDDTKKVALPLAVDGKSYRVAMILEITNNKFCSLRANSCKSCLSSFKVSFIQYKNGNGSVALMRYLSMDKSLTKNCSRSSKKLKSSDVWNTLEEHWKLYQKNIMPERGT